jgi:hypothetical protein
MGQEIMFHLLSFGIAPIPTRDLELKDAAQIGQNHSKQLPQVQAGGRPASFCNILSSSITTACQLPVNEFSQSKSVQVLSWLRK